MNCFILLRGKSSFKVKIKESFVDTLAIKTINPESSYVTCGDVDCEVSFDEDCIRIMINDLVSDGVLELQKLILAFREKTRVDFEEYIFFDELNSKKAMDIANDIKDVLGLPYVIARSNEMGLGRTEANKILGNHHNIYEFQLNDQSEKIKTIPFNKSDLEIYLHKYQTVVRSQLMFIDIVGVALSGLGIWVSAPNFKWWFVIPGIYVLFRFSQIVYHWMLGIYNRWHPQEDFIYLDPKRETDRLFKKRMNN